MLLDRVSGATLQQQGDRLVTYVFPEGCVVRNTFIEWQDATICPGSLPLEGDAAKRRRARSCPEAHRNTDDSLGTAEATDADGAAEGHRRPCRRGRTLPELGTDTKSEDGDRERGSSRSTDDADEITVVSGQSNNEPLFAFIDHNDPSLYLHQVSSPLAMTSCMGADEEAWYGNWTPTMVTGGRSALSPDSPPFTSATTPTAATTPAAAARGGANQKGNRSGRRSGGDQTSLVLRGLPFSVTEADIATFLEESGVPSSAIAGPRAITLLANQQGRPSGFAEIQLNRGTNYWEVQAKVHMQSLGGRYIEALPPRGGKSAWGASSGGRGGNGAGGGNGGSRRRQSA